MAHGTGVFTTGASTGNKVLTGLGFQPSYLRLTIGQKTGVNEGYAHQSEGSTDGTNQRCNTFFQDTTSGKTFESTARCINLMDKVTGTITDIIKATYVSFDADGFTLNFSAIVSGYHVHYEAFS